MMTILHFVVVAATFVQGRVVLVGDAAHQFPPTGGLGVNTGIQGMHNAMWKLALLLDGRAGPGLLETYTTERQPVSRWTVAQSLQNHRHVQQIALASLAGVENSMSTGDVRDRNGTRIALEPATEFLVLARLEGGAVVRLRTFTPDCDVDAGGMPIVWLTDVKPDDSVAWLTTLVAASPDTGERRDRVGKTAMTAIALHATPSADRALESFVAPARPEWLRSDTAFWLGSTRGENGARLLTRMLAQDPSDKVREKVTFGLSVSPIPSALTTLVTND